jgi:hypothetical protein
MEDSMGRGSSGAFPPVAPAKGNGGGREGGDLEQLRQALVTLGQQVGLVVGEQARLAAEQAQVVADQAAVNARQVQLADRSTEVLDKLDRVLDRFGRMETLVEAQSGHIDQLTREVFAMRGGRAV